ncbi:MAG TPA: dienelactone hydrolase family protein [Nitrososphaerales archaeon]|nr:dienelactone hydrolase family protein [Nitrososphaerales archaeon]
MLTKRGDWEFFVAKAPGPLGLVIIHEIFGYSPYVEKVATDISARGFTAAAIDLYKGKKATTLEEGFKLRTSVTKESLLDGISNGIELLKDKAGVRKVGTLGFCMGGGLALQAACDLSLDFCVDYYGSIEKEDDIAKLRGPILLVLGSDDERVTPWAFQKFLPAAMKYKKRAEVQLYPNARHAFHRPGWEGHNPQAAADAWEKTIRFLSAI